MPNATPNPPQDRRQPERQDATNKPEHPWPFNVLQQEWPIVREAKKSFLLCIGVGVIIGGVVIWFLYGTFIIPGKDATIQALTLVQPATKTNDALLTNQTILTTTEALSNLPSILSVNTNYEAFYSFNKRDFSLMSQEGIEAFGATNYAYAAMFFNQANHLASSVVTWQANCPLWYGALLAQNPTADGYRQFRHSLSNLVDVIREDVRKGDKGWFNKKNVLNAVRINLRDVEMRLPQSERTNVEDVVRQIDNIQDKLFPGP